LEPPGSFSSARVTTCMLVALSMGIRKYFPSMISVYGIIAFIIARARVTALWLPSNPINPVPFDLFKSKKLDIYLF
jgi:hypothetical protein